MTSIANLCIAILAGGLATRLRPVVQDLPKAMAPINGTPFLNYVLDSLDEQGGKNVLLCIGHKGDQLRDYYANTYRSLSLSYSIENSPLGTAGALRHCLSGVQSNDILVLNGDTYCDTDFNQFLSFFYRTQSKAAIVLVRKTNVSRFGSVEIDAEGRVVQFHEKKRRSGAGYVSAGAYLLKREIVERIPAEKEVSMEYEVLPDLIGKGLFGYDAASTFIDIGTPQSYRHAQRYFSDNIHSSRKKSAKHTIKSFDPSYLSNEHETGRTL
ncbi:MAG: nucleotidyltransferase family protein [Desulfobacteraceae bacterium]